MSYPRTNSKDPKIKLKPLLVPSSWLGNYWGMNNSAGKSLHVKHIPPPGIAYINNSLPKPIRGKILNHEEKETYEMLVRHLPYNKAHIIANRSELRAPIKGDKSPKVKAWEKRYQV